MCLGVASGYNPEKERVPKSCPFTEGIRECKEASCYHNILGGCFKKGSGYNENGEHKDFSNFERIKLMNIDELTEFLKEHKQYHCLHCSYHYEKGHCYNKDCKLGYKQWLESEYRGGDDND